MSGNRYGIIDVGNLPPLRVVEGVDIEALADARLARIVEEWTAADPPNAAIYNVGRLKFDPVYIWARASAYLESLLRDRVNQAARATTLPYAIGDDLSALAGRYPGVIRRNAGETYLDQDTEGERRYRDDKFRRRVWLASNSYSTAGSREAYVFWALTAAEGELRDAFAWVERSTYDDVIVVACMAEGQEPRPSDELLLRVRAKLTDPAIMPIDDEVSVVAPAVTRTAYRVDYVLYRGADQATVEAQMTARLQALRDASQFLGVAHRRAAIMAAAFVQGVENVFVPEPAQDIVPGPNGVGIVDEIALRLLGRAAET